MESATRRVGFRALKKTLEPPYTTKVNNRVHTSRGTTRGYVEGGHKPQCTNAPVCAVARPKTLSK